MLCLQPGFAADNAKDMLRKIKSNYEQMTACESEMEYKIYRGFESTEPVEEYTGYFSREGENSFRRIHHSDFINLPAEGLHIHADHRSRTLTLANPVIEKMFETDLEASLKYCGHIATVTSGDNLLLALYINKKNDLPYTRIDLEVDEDFFLRSITLYYAAEVNFSKDFFNPQMDRAKMKIAYVGFKTSWKDDEKKLALNTYLSTGADDGQDHDGILIPSDLYKSYRVIDLRIK
jgi:hypothetical protein